MNPHQTPTECNIRDNTDPGRHTDPAGPRPIHPAPAPPKTDGGGGFDDAPAPAPIREPADGNFQQNGLSEIGLARSLGVPRGDIAAIRKRALKNGADWLKNGREIIFTGRGVEAICAALGLDPTTVAAPAEKTGSAEPDSQDEVVEVVRSTFLNRRVIQGRRKNGELIMIQVASSANFRPRLANGRPMTLRVQPDGLLWNLVGRCPRFPGRW